MANIKNEKNRINKGFQEVFLSSELSKITERLGEVSFDSLLDDGLLKDIPFVATAISAYKTFNNFRGLFFVEKLYKLLFQLESLSEDERRKFVEILDETKKNDLFKRVLYIVDRLDEVLKAEMIGKLFKAYVEGNITNQEFLRLSLIIEKTYLNDLVCFVLSYGYEDKSKREQFRSFFDENIDQMHHIEEALVTSGLLVQSVIEDEYEARRQELVYGSSEDKVFFKTKREVSAIGRVLAIYGL